MLDGILSLLDKGSKEFYKSKEKEFLEFLKTFKNIDSQFTIDSIVLSKDRNTCKVIGTWDISFMYKEGKKNIRSNAAYSTILSLVKRNDKWNISGAKTAKK